MGKPVPAGHPTVVFVVHQWHAHPVGHAVEQGDLDRSALAVASAPDQRLQHRRMGIHAGRGVGDGDAHLAGRLGRAGDGADPAFRLNQHVISAHGTVRRVLTVAHDVDGNQTRMAGEESC